jgi:cardiolipin synthase C
MTRLLFVLIAVVWLSGCAGLAARPALARTQALVDVSDTPLARAARASQKTSHGNDQGWSGFRFLPEDEFAFNARIALIRRAQKSIDVQYYLIQNDTIGRSFLRELRDAAERGVRVRLLVDDLYAGGEDALFQGLAATPNAQVRIFNPLPSRAGEFETRLLFSLHEFGRINHRMHNKLLVADASFAISGGRNIANEYFMRSDEANFIDLDVLSSGPVVGDFSLAFDAYWNSEHAYPIDLLISTELSAREPQEVRQRFNDLVKDDHPVLLERERDILGNPPVAQELDDNALSQAFASARVVADLPDKVTGVTDATFEHTVTAQTLALFAQSREGIHIISPYFIPGERGMALIRQGIADGGKLVLVTNASGASDEPLAHERYTRYRLEMLRAGVHIFEVSPTLTSRSGRLGNFGRSTGRLHAKVAVIDKRLLFIGSMNFDQRSARANTELGLVIESPALIQKSLGNLLSNLLTAGAYELRLSADRERIQWLEPRAQGASVVHENEPESAWLARLKLWLLARFVSEDLL